MNFEKLAEWFPEISIVKTAYGGSTKVEWVKVLGGTPKPPSVASAPRSPKEESKVKGLSHATATRMTHGPRGAQKSAGIQVPELTRSLVNRLRAAKKAQDSKKLLRGNELNMDAVESTVRKAIREQKAWHARGSYHEPLHVKYGPRVHFGTSRSRGDHIGIIGRGPAVHLYKNRVFVGKRRRGGEVDLDPESLKRVQRLLREAGTTRWRRLASKVTAPRQATKSAANRELMNRYGTSIPSEPNAKAQHMKELAEHYADRLRASVKPEPKDIKPKPVFGTDADRTSEFAKKHS